MIWRGKDPILKRSKLKLKQENKQGKLSKSFKSWSSKSKGKSSKRISLENNSLKNRDKILRMNKQLSLKFSLQSFKTPQQKESQVAPQKVFQKQSWKDQLMPIRKKLNSTQI